jgi:hypothetical protein
VAFTLNGKSRPRGRSWRRRDLPGSSATPVRTCPALRPRRTGCAKATNDASDVAFRSVDGVGSAFGHISKAQSHSLFARCLRFAARITPITPRKTRFPPAANLGGAGLSPAGLLQEVSTLCLNSHRFPLLVAFLAHQPAVTPSRWMMQAARLPDRSRPHAKVRPRPRESPLLSAVCACLFGETRLTITLIDSCKSTAVRAVIQRGERVKI